MQQISSQCTNCGAFTRRSLHHEKEYESSVLLEWLRTTNFPATDQEITHIRHTILPTISDDISSIDSKVTALREVIMSMEEERERLINVQKRYNNLVSLHRTLPSEILSNIFLYTIPEDHISYTSYASDSNAFNASGFMWLLSHVCQRWRNVVLSLRSFWSTMNLRFPRAAQAEGGVQRLEAVLQRSRRGPLDVYLESGRFHDPRSDPSILTRIFDIILAESYRLRTLHLSDFDGIFNTLYPQLHNRLPHVQSLSLDGDQIDPKAQSVFKVCPRLTNLDLGVSSPVVEFPWAQILELDLSCMDPEGGEDVFRACMRLIGLCTSLEALHTSYCYWDGEAESPYPPTTCPTLRNLKAISVHFLDALTLPCLREASVHPQLSGHGGALYAFKRLLIRSNCFSALTNLSLGGMPLADSEPSQTLHSILSETQNLTFLDLDMCLQDFLEDERDASINQIVMIMDSLEVKPTKTATFLPLLSSFTVNIQDYCDAPEVTYFRLVDNFASTLKARWEGDDTVGLGKLVTFHFALQVRYVELERFRTAESLTSHLFDERQRPIFNALIDDGMDLIIRVTADLTKRVEEESLVFVGAR